MFFRGKVKFQRHHIVCPWFILKTCYANGDKLLVNREATISQFWCGLLSNLLYEDEPTALSSMEMAPLPSSWNTHQDPCGHCLVWVWENHPGAHQNESCTVPTKISGWSMCQYRASLFRVLSLNSSVLIFFRWTSKEAAWQQKLLQNLLWEHLCSSLGGRGVQKWGCAQFGIPDTPDSKGWAWRGLGDRWEQEIWEHFLMPVGSCFLDGLSLNVAQSIFWHDNCNFE